MSINVTLVDDHKMLREGIKQLLEFDPLIEVVFQASSGKECLDSLGSNDSDVYVLDINLPDMTGIKVLREIRKKNKKSKILILTVHNEVEYIIDALDSGADGYILKDSGSEELVKAIKTVFSGEQYIEPDLIPMLNARLVQMSSDTELMKELSKREKEILVAIAEGKSNYDISLDFGISEQTVKNHISNLFKKIGVKDRTQAAVFAIRNNIIRM